MDIYLDIYGTLIANASPIEDRVALLEYVLDNFPGHVYWLTSYQANRIPDVLAREYDNQLIQRLDSEVQYVNSDIYKSDSIDFDGDFLWLDDNCSEADYYALKTHNKLANFIHIIPNDPSSIKNALDIIKSR